MLISLQYLDISILCKIHVSSTNWLIQNHYLITINIELPYSIARSVQSRRITTDVSKPQQLEFASEKYP